MSSKPSAALRAAIKSTSREPPRDKLDALSAEVRRSSEIVRDIEELEEKLSVRKRDLLQLTSKTLPDMFAELGLKSLTVEASGNAPAYEAEVRPYYHANIEAEWDPARRDRAFDYLKSRDVGGEDLIKTSITVQLGRGTQKQVRAVLAALRKMKITPSVEEGVPWNTLTAFVREMVEKRRKVPQLETIGATIGTVVKIKPVKEKTLTTQPQKETY